MLKGISYYKKIEGTNKNPDYNYLERAKKYYINHFAVMNIGDVLYFELVEKFANRELEIFEELKNLNFIDYAFIDKRTIKVKTLCKPKKILNKGLEIREKKYKKQAEKRYTIKENQKDLIRIVNVTYPTFKREKGKDKFDKMVSGRGVQVENKVYFSKNFIYINKKRTKLRPVEDLTKMSEEIIKLFEEKRLKSSKS